MYNSDMEASLHIFLIWPLLAPALARPSIDLRHSREVNSGQNLATAFTPLLIECQIIVIVHPSTSSIVAEQVLLQSAFMEQPVEFLENIPSTYQRHFFLKHKAFKLVLVHFSDPSARNGLLDLVTPFITYPRGDYDLCITVAHLFSIRHHNFFSGRSTCLFPANHLLLLYSGGATVMDFPWRMKAYSLHFRCPEETSNCMKMSLAVETTGQLLYGSIMQDTKAVRWNFYGALVDMSSMTPNDDPDDKISGLLRHKIRYARDIGMPVYELTNFLNFTIYMTRYSGAASCKFGLVQRGIEPKDCGNFPVNCDSIIRDASQLEVLLRPNRRFTIYPLQFRSLAGNFLWYVWVLSAFSAAVSTAILLFRRRIPAQKCKALSNILLRMYSTFVGQGYSGGDTIKKTCLTCYLRILWLWYALIMSWIYLSVCSSFQIQPTTDIAKLNFNELLRGNYTYCASINKYLYLKYHYNEKLLRHMSTTLGQGVVDTIRKMRDRIEYCTAAADGEEALRQKLSSDRIIWVANWEEAVVYREIMVQLLRISVMEVQNVGFVFPTFTRIYVPHADTLILSFRRLVHSGIVAYWDHQRSVSQVRDYRKGLRLDQFEYGRTVAHPPVGSNDGLTVEGFMVLTLGLAGAATVLTMQSLVRQIWCKTMRKRQMGGRRHRIVQGV